MISRNLFVKTISATLKRCESVTEEQSVAVLLCYISSFYDVVTELIQSLTLPHQEPQVVRAQGGARTSHCGGGEHLQACGLLKVATTLHILNLMTWQGKHFLMAIFCFYLVFVTIFFVESRNKI